VRPAGCSSVFVTSSRARPSRIFTFRMVRARRRKSPEAALTVRLSKIKDYLADNFCALILSRLLDWVQEQSGWPDAAGSKLGIRRPLFEQCNRDSLAGRGRVSLKRCDCCWDLHFAKRSKNPPKQSLDGAPSGVR